MSNNIYDILKKFNNLSSVKNMLAEGKKVCKDCGKAKCECVTESKGSKPDYIDLDKDGDTNEPMKKAAKDKSKGAIAEAVARVEQNLAEKYQGFKKSVEEGVQAKGVINPTDSGEEYTAAPGYRVKAEFEPGSTSKPKMGFVKSEPEQTGQGAKPADQTKSVNKKEVDESGLQAYLGKKKYGEQGMKALQKAGRDGASKEKMAMIRAKHDKMDEDIIGVREGEMTEAVEAFTPEDIEAAINYRNAAGPIWQIKNGKIRFYLMNMDRMALDDMLSRPLASQQDWDMLKKQIKKQLQDSQGTMDEDMLSPGQKKIAKMSPPPNKIDANDLAALRAGKKKKSEGNAFSGAVAKAKATGADEFEVGGKEYKVQEGIEDTLQNILPKSMQPFNTETAAKNAAAAKASRAQAPVKEDKNMPPKDLDELEAWAAGSPGRKSFSLVAKFGIINNMNLQQTLEVLQNFDDENYAREYFASKNSPKALHNSTALFNAYENVYDAWIPPDFDYNEPESSTWVAESFPTVADAKKRMDAKSGKTAHGTKTVTKTGVKHERNYDADEPTGERGRPKKDKFAK
jgi:hypothetical protein